MRLNGGEFLLNLLVLGTLTISSESVTITDESVIEQLTGLKNYINNEKAIKPLFVKYDNGTEIVVGKGEIRKTKGALSFELVCVTKSNSLTINVAFTQKVNANDDLIDDYEIESGDATLTFTNEVQIFENIVDKNGHKRFIEGDIELLNTVPEGITKEYGKWSLSGSHLLIVLAISVVNGTSFNGDFCQFNLPDWITDKIATISNQYVDIRTLSLYDNNLSAQSVLNFLRKYPNGLIAINSNSFTASANRTGRIAFDLLIDNE